MSAARVFELASHLTERDREIVLCLYDHQVLTTDQLELLFSSKRRAQDRLLFLYRYRLLDRFCPPSPFGSGKPQAHWLLDEAGAILVDTILGVERKQLGWQRGDDWASHPQLRHRLELNRFVTDLIAATLLDPATGVRAWYSSREAAELPDTERLRPDAGLVLDTAAGAIECWLEWESSLPVLTVEIALDVWPYWLDLGTDHAVEALETRERLKVTPADQGTRVANLLEFECKRSMVAITAAAFALDGFYALVRRSVPQIRSPISTRNGRGTGRCGTRGCRRHSGDPSA